MPIHDWTRVAAGIFHDFHQAWITEIKRTLNGGLLPTGFYALAEQIAGGLGPDVLTLEVPPGTNLVDTSTEDEQGGVAVAVRPPKVQFHAKTEIDGYAAKANAIAIRHTSGHRVVAMLEIVSPGNKNARHAFRNFVDKAEEVLRAGVHLLILDLIPPGTQDPDGIHPPIWDRFDNGKGFHLPANKRLTLASYVAGECPEAYVEPVTTGIALPEMPLFLNQRRYIPVPLEQTYKAAWELVPAYWRDVLTKPVAH